MTALPTPKPLSATLTDLGAGVYQIDAQYVRPELAAIYLIVERDRAALIETGTRHSLPQVLAALDQLGVAPSAVEFVVPTHVHLDHAGGAGAMMEAFSSASLVVHARGARHMADPSRLWAGTVEVYGELAARDLYGEILPVPPGRIIEAGDEMQVDLAGRKLRFLDTPGHSKHHVCIVDERTGCIFTGDTFGLSYRELDVDGRPSVLITTTPTQFDPDEMRRSIGRLVGLRPPAMFMTHYSRVGDVERLAGELLRQLDESVRIARRHAGRPAGLRTSAIEGDLIPFFRAEGERLGWRLSAPEFARIVAPDLRLNAQGLAHWIGNAATQS